MWMSKTGNDTIDIEKYKNKNLNEETKNQLKEIKYFCIIQNFLCSNYNRLVVFLVLNL